MPVTGIDAAPQAWISTILVNRVMLLTAVLSLLRTTVGMRPAMAIGSLTRTASVGLCRATEAAITRLTPAQSSDGARADG
jgi:hypothetical protein